MLGVYMYMYTIDGNTATCVVWIILEQLFATEEYLTRYNT